MRDKFVGTLDQVADYLAALKWFSQSKSILVDVSRLDAAGQVLARETLDLYSQATGLRFVESSLHIGAPGIIFDDEQAGGYAQMVYTLPDGELKTVLVNIYKSEAARPKHWALYTYLHEVGHALGLRHPGPYKGGYGTGNHFVNDSIQLTVMSYFNQQQNTWLDADRAYPVTPMAADILALEKLYGDSNAVRTGDTVYGFNSNAGGYFDKIAGIMKGITPSLSQATLAFTLIDDGGIDTFDYADAVRGSRVDLRPGAVSDVFGAKGAMVIYKDTVIENFLGGTGDDDVTGNDAANTLVGNGGDDTLVGGAGDDTLDGGAGDDILDGGAGDDTLTGGAGADTFRYPLIGFGADTIIDFTDGTDRIDFRNTGLSFADLTLSVSGKDLIIDAGSGNTITLTRQAGVTLDQADFLFGSAPLHTATIAGLIADVRGYAAETYPGADGVTRWQRVLKALGETDAAFANLTPMTAAEAQTYANNGWPRWDPVVTVLTDIEAQQQPEVSIGDVTVTEGGNAQFTVSLDKAWGYDVTVDYITADGSATAGRDYTGVSAAQTLIIPARQQHATITVATTDDNIDEPNETFTVALSNPTNATLGDAIGTATLTDNDDLIADVRGYAAETNSGAEHVTRWQRVLKALGETDAAFASLTPMTAAEAQTYANNGWPRWDPVVTALRAIEAQQPPPPPPVASINDVTITEGGNAQFTVSLDRVSGSDVTVDYSTANGTATAGSDYAGVSKAPTLTIAAGQSSATITVQTTDDSTDEPDETFTVTLSNPVNAVLGDATGEATVTDNDSPPALSIGDVTVTEGGAAQFTLTLDAVSGKDVTVSWATTDGTASASSDYTARSGQSVTIAAGQQRAMITVATTDDSIDEPDETFTVTLSNPVNTTLGDARGEATITDNDDPPPPSSDNPYADLITKVRGYAAETGNGDAHVLRWQRVLKALGETDAAFASLTPMTAAQAQNMADTYTAARWDPVVTALTELEAQQPPDTEPSTPSTDPEPEPQPDPDPLPDSGTRPLPVIDGLTLISTSAFGEVLMGSAANDRLDGNAGGDVLVGKGGDDLLDGGDGHDRLYGGDGDDHLDGGPGDDRIDGGGGDDLLTGGTGTDFFYIYADDGHDVITDFDSATKFLIFWRVAFRSVQDLRDNYVTEQGDDLVIYTDTDRNHSVTLEDFVSNGGQVADLNVVIA